METAWDSEIADFLQHLSAVQQETLDMLVRKRELLARTDAQGLAALGGEEEGLVARLQECLQRRQALLERAAHEGLPGESVQSLADALPARQRKPLRDQVRQAAHRARLLQHHSLVNWVLVQRTLIHLSQLLEIIATGGRLKPTYQKDGPTPNCGALIDRAA